MPSLQEKEFHSLTEGKSEATYGHVIPGTVRATVRCLLRNHLDAAQLAEQLPSQLHSWEGSCSTVQRSFCSKSTAVLPATFMQETNQIEVKADKDLILQYFSKEN